MSGRLIVGLGIGTSRSAGVALRRPRRWSLLGVAISASMLTVGVLPLAAAQEAATNARIDYLTFAHGAVPIAIGASGAAAGTTFEHAIRAIDGNNANFALHRKLAGPATQFEFIYQLPAPTTFDRFAVPGVVETPSPGQTFVREVEVHGSASGRDDDYVLLASGTLAVGRTREHASELTLHAKRAVRRVKLRLQGGLDASRPQMFFEFSEIVGNGTQEPAALSNRFSGAWKGRGVQIALKQDGPLVTGCYDKDGDFSGTVSGNMLVGTGIERGDRVPSAFVLTVMDDGSLRGLRSTNRAPFALYVGEAGPAKGASCSPPARARLGCGSIVHGIAFDFDSAAIRAESGPVLAKLADGLRVERSSGIVIEGHTSSEGSDDYNRQLSERRAQAVVADLAARGVDRGRLAAAGLGETRPIATNDDENGRALNRRVEVKCR